MATLRLVSAKTAVLSMDCQSGIVSTHCKEHKDSFLNRIASVLKFARANGIFVIHVQVAFRPGMPEINRNNLFFSRIKSSPQHQRLFEEPLAAFPAAIAPAETDIVVTKRRISAFAGTDLDLILRAKHIETLVLFGIATSGVVLSTLVDAVDADYNVAVIKDCCTDLNSALHDCLISNFFPSRAAVLSAEEFINSSQTSVDPSTSHNS